MGHLTPIITLCDNTTCGRRSACYRSVMLPIYKDVYGQHVTDFHFDLRECRNFLHADPVKRAEAARQWREDREREARARAADEAADRAAEAARLDALAAMPPKSPSDLFGSNVVPMRRRTLPAERKKKTNGGIY